ncbi:MAG: hypothetical protein A3B31_01550 [Candidatus Komeilibacteria bacterium RIFCSPLOWO2_01_FULL_53_11]|uniref:Uncharacterized protein n=1 Tax=Candidatus Komeilibacteria bacterium RIFCSPLOWO2_01_FULL_53_11 TaxID=1798552 RepID=A0A1G2BQ86_9BACT|nr:MAG: hypothetical protein A3B31_01550 [Candidatus Komeilibacteria bacterium RIFCSPLOWO2_01_FULL_53_11]
MQPITLAPTECCMLRLAARTNQRFVEEYATTESPLLVGMCVEILENTYRMGWRNSNPSNPVQCFYRALATVERERLKLASDALPCNHRKGAHEEAISSLLEKFTVTVH